MPSGRAALHAELVRRSRRGRLLRASGWAFSTLFVLVLLLVGAVYFAVSAGVGADRLREEASRAVSAMVGFEVRTEIGSTWLTLDKSRFLALQASDVKAVRIDTGETLLDAGYLRFGLRFNPLLDGQLRLGNAMIADARLDLGALPESEGPGWTSGLLDERGLIDPDLINERLFEALRLAFNAVAVGDTRNLALRNVTVVIGREAPVELEVESFAVNRPQIGHIDLDGRIAVDNRHAAIAGKARRNLETSIIDAVELSLDISELEDGIEVEKYAFLEGLGAARLAISGREGRGAAPSRLDTRIGVDSFLVRLEHGRELGGAIEADASLVSGTRKLEVNSGKIRTGRSTFDFNGAIGPIPAGQGDAAYRYEFVSDRSISAPLDSDEPALEFVAKVAGEYDPRARRLTASNIGVRTANGEIIGNAITTFVEGMSPGLFLSISVPELPVAEAKQLWPFFAAPGARRWVVGNLYAGKVVDSNLRIDVPPGGFEDGIPMTHEEAFGRFEVQATRFDLPGRLPPVRDAFGIVDFRGTDVDIALSSGTVYMGEGRSVAASNGTLVLRNSHLNPLIGQLALDVAGQAPAIVELASYDPINVSRYIDLPPEKVAGDVTGKVVAEIPLQRDARAADMAWDVALNFTKLTLDQDFEGQRIAEADGTLLVDPTRAEFKASGKLNGIPAEVSLLEPFGRTDMRRRTDVALVVDDNARKALFPGLDTILGGSARVRLAETAEKGKRAVTADLRQSVIKLPWIGWSKGVGVPAEATFDIVQDGNRIAISNFRLSGESFAARGAIDLTDGNLVSARFNAARLHRDDDFTVAIARQRGGYAVDVKGKRFDARSVIKMALDSPASGGAAGDDTPVTVNAALEQLRGFGSEVLGNVQLSYASGGNSGSLDLSATTGNGVQVSMADRTEGGRRSVAMNTRDGGAVLRFLDIYERMRGGTIEVALAGPRSGVLSGKADIRNFEIVNEPRLASVVSSRAAGADRSLNDALNQQLDVSRVPFEHAFANVEKGPNTLRVANGVLRGPTIGVSFQGLVSDADDNIDLTGTFMPAYGINRMFGEIPLVGLLLGNGRDRALIGITFRLAGKFNEPQVQVNPISAIAPGIFRSIFEYR